jgi:hypothetical protein
MWSTTTTKAMVKEDGGPEEDLNTFSIEEGQASLERLRL